VGRQLPRPPAHVSPPKSNAIALAVPVIHSPNRHPGRDSPAPSRRRIHRSITFDSTPLKPR
jgi:hypothetical protein